MNQDVTSGSDSSPSSDTPASCRLGQGPWTPEEHERFLVATTLFARGPWSDVAQYIGTRTTRQSMAHAQKTNLRRARHARGLKQPGRVAGPNARRRPQSRRRLIMSSVAEPMVDFKLELLFAQPTALSIDTKDVFLGSFVTLHEHDNHHTSGEDENQGTADWLDDFVQSFDLSEFTAA